MVLLVILVLNVYKPPGLTRHGWRKQQEERRKQQDLEFRRIGAAGATLQSDRHQATNGGLRALSAGSREGVKS